MIYIDELIIINYLIDYYEFILIGKILNIKNDNKKIIISSLIGEMSIIFILFNFSYIVNILVKILLCLLMIYNLYGKYNLLRNSLLYLFISFMIGGFIYYYKDLKIFNYKYLFLFVPFFLNIIKKISYNLKNNINLFHKVSIYLNNGEVLYLNGYMDSGNSLIEPYTNKKVIFIDKNVNELFYLVPYKTINRESLIKCFTPKKVYIDGIGERKDISVGIINYKFKGYNCLLNYKLLEE